MRPLTTVHLDPGSAEDVSESLLETIRGFLRAGKSIAVTVVEEDAALSPQQAGRLLGFSRQHVVRLIEAGELEAERLPNSRYWKVPRRAIEEFGRKREAAEERAATLSRDLDRLGAPLE